MLNHQQIAVEGKIDVACRCHVREHKIVAVGVDTTTPTLAAIHFDGICTAILNIDLGVYKLVASEDDSRLNLPHKEIVVCHKVTSHILLHCQIKWQLMLYFVRQSNIFHRKIFFCGKFTKKETSS